MRDELYEAAMQLFAERPYAEVTVAEICERGMAGRATFFRLYESKAGLLSEYNRRLAAQVREALSAAKPSKAEDALRVVAEVVVAGWGPEHPGVNDMAQEVVATSSYVNVDAEVVPDLQHVIAEILVCGRESGELTFLPNERTVAWLIVATMTATVFDWFEFGLPANRPYDQVSSVALELIVRGLIA
ncbi:hypothetical protein BS297_27430 [Rhodococcus erythropolis]|uniref:HTH tetR-type domain-containing protein n=1 Tax=Rhodococcus erythropolis TaxID=1833 RepID=A0A5N5DVS7_RHOER|nr:hypothetical protein BS297_27430 [Rhodococcus erythropolis]